MYSVGLAAPVEICCKLGATAECVTDQMAVLATAAATIKPAMARRLRQSRREG
jgi:hypothetical protein